MDAQAERRFQQLKRKLDALQYCQPLSFESAALAEKLLNDLLKSTEAFNKLKKMNDQLKSQVGSEGQYQEPMKRENERVMAENNQLHLEVIRLKEELHGGSFELKNQVKQLQDQNQDIQFLCSQKDNKITDLDRQVAEMRKKLQQALTSTQYGPSSEIQKAFGRTNEDQNAQFSMTNQLDGAQASQNDDFKQQQDIWAMELSRADERGAKFKNENDQLIDLKRALEAENQDLKGKVQIREQEISRLHLAFNGGQSFDAVKSNHDTDKLQSDNQSMRDRLDDIAQILAVSANSDLGEQVAKLKMNLEDLREDNQELSRMLDQLREGQYNQAAAGKMVSSAEESQLKQILAETEQRFQELERENHRLRSENDRSGQQQSAVQSNNQAAFGKLEFLERQAHDKDEKLGRMKTELDRKDEENFRLSEEVNLQKGRCANLLRDKELSSSAMNKLSNDQGGLGEQLDLYKTRVSQLEEDLQRSSEEKSEQAFEIKRLSVAKEKLEERMQNLQAETIKNQGSNQTSGATIGRLQGQLNGTKNDLELMIIQKGELEKVIKAQKNEILDAERKSQDYYTQLLSTKENFQVLHNEQRLLSEELTGKQMELQKAEREKLNQERELLQLRPLSNQLQSFSAQNRTQIEANVRTEFERDKLQKTVMEIQNENDRMKTDNGDLVQKNLQLTQQTGALVEQLRNFEQESFEIQTRIKRGLEVENENKNNGQAISSLRDTERELQRQIDQINQQLTLKNSELNRANGKVETLQSYNQTIEHEVSDLRNRVSQLNEEIHGGQSETIKHEHKKNQYEIEIFDLKKQIEIMRDDNKKQCADLSISQKEQGDYRQKCTNLIQQVDRLKSLVENLDQNKEELIKRLQAASSDKRGEVSDKAILQNDIANYKREIISKDQEILDLKQSIASLDANLDEMQSDLDQKTEELSHHKQRLEKQTFDFGNMQNQVSVIAGKEDEFQRRLFERENEIKLLRQENQNFREQVEHQQQIIQVKVTEASELTEDIQTLSRENKFVNSEFAKSTQANEFLKRQNEQLSDQERLGQQGVRALEMEKQDVLQNYRDSCAENERHQDAIKQVTDEHSRLYQKCLDMEKNAGGSTFFIKELQQKEQNYIAEIKTLERHLDHLTHQLELAHKAMRELQEERDGFEVEINNHKTMSMNIESNKEGLQRQCAQLEQDKQFMAQQINDLKIESSALRQQSELEKAKFLDLERVIQNERTIKHEQQFMSGDFQRQNQELLQELERQSIRVQSLQSHIDTLQRYGGSSSAPQLPGSGTPGHNQLDQAHQTIDNLRRENDQSKMYIQQYENQIRDLEHEVNSISQSNLRAE